MRPELRSSRNGAMLFRIDAQTHPRIVDPQDAIVFANLRGRDFARAPVRISIRTKCAVGDLSPEIEREFADVSEIQVLALLPIEAIAAPQSPNQAFACTIDFVARNDAGSIHRFALRDFQIEAPVNEAGLKVTVAGRSFEPADWKTNLVSFDALGDGKIEPLGAERADGPAQISLVCEKFVVNRAVPSLEAFELAEFMRSSARARRDGRPYLAMRARPQAAEELDLEQICRFVYASPGSMRASAYFRFHLASPGLKFTARAVTIYAHPSALQSPTIGVFRIVVQNDDLVPRTALLPVGSPNALRIRALFVGGIQLGPINYEITPGPVLRTQARWTIDGAPAMDSPLGKRVTIQPGRRVEATVVLTRRELCNPLANGVQVGVAEDIAPRALFKAGQDFASLGELARAQGQLRVSTAADDLPYVAAPIDFRNLDSAAFTDVLPSLPFTAPSICF